MLLTNIYEGRSRGGGELIAKYLVLLFLRCECKWNGGQWLEVCNADVFGGWGWGWGWVDLTYCMALMAVAGKHVIGEGESLL